MGERARGALGGRGRTCCSMLVISLMRPANRFWRERNSCTSLGVAPESAKAPTCAGPAGPMGGLPSRLMASFLRCRVILTRRSLRPRSNDMWPKVHALGSSFRNEYWLSWRMKEVKFEWL